MADPNLLDLQRRIIPGGSTAGLIHLFDDGNEAYLAIRFICKTNVARGNPVCIDQANNQRVIPVPTGGNMNDLPMGIATETILAGNPVWVAIMGLVYILPDLLVTAVVGDNLVCSTVTAGRVTQAATVPVAATHFKEVGHWFENGSGNGVMARAIIHFN